MTEILLMQELIHSNEMILAGVVAGCFMLFVINISLLFIWKGMDN